MEPFSGAFQRNIEHTHADAEQYWAVYACITLIAQDIAKLPIRVVKKRNGIFVPEESHPVSKLLKRPNDYQNRMQFIMQWVLSNLRRGNAYIRKEGRIGQVPSALHVLHADYTKPLVSDGGEVFYDVRPDNLTGTGRDLGKECIPAMNIIHDRMPALYHPLVGITPIMAAALSSYHGLNMQQAAAKFFKDNCLPSGILSTPQNIDNAMSDQIRKEWQSKYGPGGTGGVAVLTGGLSYESMSMSYADSMLLDQMQWTPVEICAVFHVPPYKIGVGEMPQSRNIGALNQQYLIQCLQYHIEGIEMSLTEAFDLEDGYCVQMDTDALLRMDAETLMAIEEKGVKAGIFKPNESRRTFNRAPVVGGDTPYMQQQNYSLEALNRRDEVSASVSPELMAALEAEIAGGI